MRSSMHIGKAWLFIAMLIAMLFLFDVEMLSAQAIGRGFQERVINLASNVALRLSSAIERYTDIIERLESRMTKLEGAGVDTAAPRAKLGEAKDSLTRAVSLQSELGSLTRTLTSDSPRQAMKTLRTQFLSIREELRVVHRLLRETIALLKDAVAMNEEPRGVSDAVSNENAETEAE